MMMCTHPSPLNLDYIPQSGADTNVLILTIRVSCPHCGPLRFIGTDEGISLRRPCTSTDGLVVHIPVVGQFEEPETDRRLAS